MNCFPELPDQKQANANVVYWYKTTYVRLSDRIWQTESRENSNNSVNHDFHDPVGAMAGLGPVRMAIHPAPGRNEVLD